MRKKRKKGTLTFKVQKAFKRYEINVMKLPIGISDFKEVIENRFYYVDKSLLIDELEHTNGKVILLPRPRRFGKTLNLSMLRYFYENSIKNNAHLFEKLAIWQQKYYRSQQGIFPVISITFKSCKDSTWEKIHADMVNVITQECRRHFKQLAPSLTDYELEDYNALINKTATASQYTNALFFLCMLLKRHYKKKVMVLIDEYDAPLHAAYTHGYYKQMMEFMRALLTDVLKDNSYLERGVLTGILRTGKEGIFSGLNNLTVKTLLDEKFSDKFGFTEQEVSQLLADAKLSKKAESIKEWYNGYRCGKTTIYNPWSLLECVSNKGELEPYWVNTSDNEIIKRLIAQADDTLKAELESVLQGAPVTSEIKNSLTLSNLENDPTAAWSLLLFSGYVTFSRIKRVEGKTLCTLTLPNNEIKVLYKDLITSIVEQSLGRSQLRYLKQSLIEADGELFGTILQEFTLKSISAFDLPKNEPERSYHLFVLGLLVTLSDTYEVISNRESGYGRYDIMLIPHNKKQWGIILEFKKIDDSSTFTLEKTAQKALDQIVDMQYAQDLKAHGVKKIAAFGVACKGKKTFVKALHNVA